MNRRLIRPFDPVDADPVDVDPVDVDPVDVVSESEGRGAHVVHQHPDLRVLERLQAVGPLDLGVAQDGVKPLRPQRRVAVADRLHEGAHRLVAPAEVPHVEDHSKGVDLKEANIHWIAKHGVAVEYRLVHDCSLMTVRPMAALPRGRGRWHLPRADGGPPRRDVRPAVHRLPRDTRPRCGAAGHRRDRQPLR